MSDQRDESAYQPGAVFAAFVRAHGMRVPLDDDPPPASEAGYAKALEACRQGLPCGERGAGAGASGPVRSAPGAGECRAVALEDAFGLRDAGRQGARDPRGKQATLARNRNLALDIAMIEKVGPGPGFKGPPEKLAYAIAAIAQCSGVAAPTLEKLWQPLAEAARAAVARQMAAFGLA